MLNDASTGPRPRGRGMSIGRIYGKGAGEASTGPRPRGRGMKLGHRVTCRLLERFNGAAPARARNADFPLFRALSNCKLQRGRARAGAEWEAIGRYLGKYISLQRGRARAGAE